MFALLFDPSAGAAGDMIMASLLDLGADEKRVRKAVESVGCTLEVSRQEKGHISATRAQVISDRESGRSKGFGFVEMDNDQEAQAAIDGLNGKPHEGRPLTVNEARPREDRGGRGGGGGFGGGRRF